MNLYNHFAEALRTCLAEIGAAEGWPDGLPVDRVTVEPPRETGHGDIATNAAMVLAKPLKRKPRDLADIIVAALLKVDGIDAAEIAGPGFINLRIAPDLWRAQLLTAIEGGDRYGDSDVGAGRKVNVEYVSANPTGPLHVGHLRGAVFGDALASLLAKAGYDVLREYYINDAGNQVDALARSTHLRYREALGQDIGEIPEGMYPGDYLVPVGEAIAAEDGDKWLGKDEAEWLGHFRRAAVARMMDRVRDDLAALGIEQKVFFSEQSLHDDGRIDAALAALTDKGLIYEGVLEPPKGKTPEDWEPRPQTLFKATQFGDDVDRPLKKSDGAYTYFAADIAYHFDKVRRGYADMIDVWGADHGGYVKRMKAAVAALTDGEGDLDIKLCQIVRVLRDGQPVRMSKRAGDFVTAREVLDEAGRDVVRFMMLTRRNDAQLDFDLAQVKEQSKDNPVFYVQYAHARCRSILRNVGRDMPDALAVPDVAGLSRLADPAELDLVKQLAAWPRTVEAAAAAHEPHRIAFYLYDLAAAFHGLWNKGNEDPALRFIIDGDSPLTAARVTLVRAVAATIAAGLAVMGVEPAEEMH
ncbi:MAG: arginine--tRNA ligase [Alphaproteobacteria bacterium]